MNRSSPVSRGFTLIELSIVLVIIGLIVGGVLVGQDLIRAAEVRATISQIERYRTAVNTFLGKYNALPGDLNAATAATFGFGARGTNPGQGDGNGIIEGYASGTTDGAASWGETTMFWQDLTSANGLNVNLVEGAFSTTTSTTYPPGQVTGASIDLYLPQAKLGKGNYIYVYSGGGFAPGWQSTGTNYFGLGVITDMDPGSGFDVSPGLTVQQAYSIDKKLDDGLPYTGGVTYQYVSGGVIYAPSYFGTGATAGSASSCFDNGNVASATQQYSLGQNNGNGVNCTLSFQFQ